MTDLTEEEKNNIIQSLATNNSSEFYNDIYDEKIIIADKNRNYCIFCNEVGNKYTIFNDLLSFNCFCSMLCKISFESIISNIYDFNYPYSLIPFKLYSDKQKYLNLKQYLQCNIDNYDKFKLFTEFKDNVMTVTMLFVNKNEVIKRAIFNLIISTEFTKCLYCNSNNLRHQIKCYTVTLMGCCSILCKQIFENYIINTLKPITHTKCTLLPFELICSDTLFVETYKKYKHNNNITAISYIRYDMLHVILGELVSQINNL